MKVAVIVISLIASISSVRADCMRWDYVGGWICTQTSPQTCLAWTQMGRYSRICTQSQ